MMSEPIQDKPQDLSMKASRKHKPIPPPLDLNARTLNEEDVVHRPMPKSPADMPRECLPIRKRALVEVRKDLNCKSPKSAGLDRLTPFSDYRNSSTAPSSPLQSAPPRLPLPSTLALTPSSGGSLSSFTHFPVPPPLVPVPRGGTSDYHPKSPFLPTSNGFPTPPTELHSPYWTGIFQSPFSPVLPHSPLHSSALLSPAPSYHSSTNSSREDLPQTDPKRRYLSAPFSHAADSTSPVPSSPLLSPARTWSHNWPTPVWQCFVAGTTIRFLLANTDTPWQKAEELGWKDRIALKVDSRNQYQYAPSGLTVVKVEVVSRDGALKQEVGETAKTLLRLRMAPHRMDNSPEILAECPLDHPFFVKEKGWCSAQPRLTIEKYGIPCQDLSVGDVCLPPNHPEAVRTPDLCDRFRRFEFGSVAAAAAAAAAAEEVQSPLARPMPRHVGGAKLMSPPMSPAKPKKEKEGADKPKRPMNGFMLFAKKYRLELIQQHPGKDNRAISVLLGEAWKLLPQEEREQYSHKAKVMADEQKKLYPDCWKRKRKTTNGEHASTTSTTSAPNTPLFAPMTSSMPSSMLMTSSLSMTSSMPGASWHHPAAPAPPATNPHSISNLIGSVVATSNVST